MNEEIIGMTKETLVLNLEDNLNIKYTVGKNIKINIINNYINKILLILNLILNNFILIRILLLNI